MYHHLLHCFLSFCSALIKQVNKSIEGTADDEDEGVPTEQAIRAGLELLKVNKPLLDPLPHWTVSVLLLNPISTETYMHVNIWIKSEFFR